MAQAGEGQNEAGTGREYEVQGMIPVIKFVEPNISLGKYQFRPGEVSYLASGYVIDWLTHVWPRWLPPWGEI